MYTPANPDSQSFVLDFQAWAKDNVGEGHTFIESNGLIVVNHSIDVSVAYLIHLSATDEQKLKQLVQVTKALSDSNQNLHALPRAHQQFIRRLHRSSGGRLRFRVHIGPTAGGVSPLEQFIATYITPAIPSSLPDFITQMSVEERSRLYDLANARGRTPELHRKSIAWALEQNPTSISELVNYTEYYVASYDRLEEDIDERSLEEFEAGREDIELPFDEITVLAVELAKADAMQVIRRKYTHLIGKIMRHQVTDENRATLSQLTGQDYSALDFSNRDVKNAKRAEVLAAISAKVKEASLQPTPSEEHLAKAEELLRDEKEQDSLKTIRQKVRASMENWMQQNLASQFAAQRQEANLAGFAGLGPQIERFWDKEDEEKIDSIKGAASMRIPFMSDHAAAYHALKHYHEIKYTEDRAQESGKSELESYLDSATKTIAAPTEPVTQELSQFNSNPIFFFIRTVKHASSLENASDSAMRAIVVVGDVGEVHTVTYFRAP